jgi:hypothetical protein
MTTPPDAGNRRGRATLSQHDLIIAELFDRYIQRRDRGETPYAHDLLAAAAEYRDTATDVLRVLLGCYEATRAREDPARGRPDTPPHERTPPGLWAEAGETRCAAASRNSDRHGLEGGPGRRSLAGPLPFSERSSEQWPWLTASCRRRRKPSAS